MGYCEYIYEHGRVIILMDDCFSITFQIRSSTFEPPHFESATVDHSGDKTSSRAQCHLHSQHNWSSSTCSHPTTRLSHHRRSRGLFVGHFFSPYTAHPIPSTITSHPPLPNTSSSSPLHTPLHAHLILRLEPCKCVTRKVAQERQTKKKIEIARARERL